MERITIVGMGIVGASMGLALRKARLADTEIVGTSASRDALSLAARLGAVDKTESRLRPAVEGARLLVLDVPGHEAMEILEAVGPLLEPGCVVTDTAGPKTRVIEAANRHLPDRVGFVGGHPVLRGGPTPLESADPAIFKGIDYCVLPPDNTDPLAIQAVVHLVETLEARPLFLDVAEHDSYVAALACLPALLSSAYVNATVESSGWREMRQLASSDFDEMSGLASRDPRATQAGCLATPDLLMSWLDQLIAELQTYRRHVQDESADELLNRLVDGWEGRARWAAGVTGDQGEPKLPSPGRYMANALLGERLVERFRRLGNGKEKKAAWKYDKGR